VFSAAGQAVEEHVHALPGVPRRARAAPGAWGRSVLFCDGPSGPVLLLLDAAAGVVAERVVGGETARDGAAALEVTEEGVVLALVTGYARDASGESRVSHLYRIGADLAVGLGASGPLPGGGEGECLRPLNAAGSRCWVETRDRAAGFAHATLLDFTDVAKGVVGAQYAFGGVTAAFAVAPSPDGETVAVARDEQVELLDGDGATRATADFAAPVAALRWVVGGVLVAEAGRLHYLSRATGAVERTIAVGEGWVTTVLEVPGVSLPAKDVDADGLSGEEDLAQGTSVRLEDSDGDGIHDGVDPEPTVVSPRVWAPAEVVFHGGAAGREVRVFVPGSDAGPAGAWTLDFDREAMPWLRVYPLSSAQGGGAATPVQLAVDPAYYDPSAEATGALTLRMAGTAPGASAAGSPAAIQLRVAPGRSAPRRILWLRGTGESPGLWTPGNAGGLGELAALLSGAPHVFSHREHAGPFTESLAGYTLVVVSAAAVAEVPVSRRALLDYVQAGGALLVLGQAPGAGQVGAAAPWLDEIGFQIALASRASGATERVRGTGPGAAWADFALGAGCVVHCDPAYVLARFRDTPEAAALAARDYGYGRIAVLASLGPLGNGALAGALERRFTERLFRWLGRAGLSLDDYDGDGLVNGVENPNGNAVVEPGETNALVADTDGDGLPDGMEDVNLNGRLDPGETDPRRVDTDGDGVADGADETPLGVPGAH